MHAVGLDALQPPGVGAQQEGVADAALVDELLVQLADAQAVAGVGGVLAGVGNDAAVDEGGLPAAGQGEEAVVNAVPADARLQALSRRRAGRAASSTALTLRLAVATDTAH